jgi:hypothetical protein
VAHVSGALAAAGYGSATQLAAHFSEDAKGRFYQLLQVGVGLKALAFGALGYTVNPAV